jgi:hypothetical protein
LAIARAGRSRGSRFGPKYSWVSFGRDSGSSGPACAIGSAGREAGARIRLRAYGSRLERSRDKAARHGARARASTQQDRARVHAYRRHGRHHRDRNGSRCDTCRPRHRRLDRRTRRRPDLRSAGGAAVVIPATLRASQSPATTPASGSPIRAAALTGLARAAIVEPGHGHWGVRLIYAAPPCAGGSRLSPASAI